MRISDEYLTELRARAEMATTVTKPGQLECDVLDDLIDARALLRPAAPLHEEVVRHAEDYAEAVRHYRRPPEVVAAADALVAFARGGR